MEFEELQAAWRELNRRVEHGESLIRDTRKRVHMDHVRTVLRYWSWVPAIELAFGIVTVLFVGFFLARHWTSVLVEPAGMIPGLLIAALGLAVFAASVRQLSLIAGIDYAAPVITMQRRMHATRRLRLQMTWWDLLIGIPLWPVFVIFVLQTLGSYGSYRLFSPTWLLVNFLAGLAIVAMVIGIARWLSRQAFASPMLARVAEEITGKGLTRAIAEMDELTRFEQSRD